MPIYRSPAKINLFLKVLSKRPDGYHELSTLMQTVDLCDSLEIQLTTGPDQLTCTDSSLPTDGRNLAMKAANLFRAKTAFKFNIHIHLEKKIPHQAGLGGGSSNCATTLWALNDLFGRVVSYEDLLKWAGELGSDIPFFLSEGTALCTGRGEKIKPLPALPSQQLWILKHAQGLSTPEVFQRLKFQQKEAFCPQEALDKIYRGMQTFTNDLEVPAFGALPILAQIKQQLLNTGYEHVTLTGSGSALYCFQGPNILDAPNISGVKCFETRYLNRARDHWY